MATNGWEKIEETSFGHDALHALTTRFFVPLNNASVDCSVLLDEWDAMVDYAKRYLDLVRDNDSGSYFNQLMPKIGATFLSLLKCSSAFLVANGRVHGETILSFEDH